MRIVIHSYAYHPDTSAAARRFIGLGECLASMGHEVDVICAYPDYVDGKRRKWWRDLSSHEIINGVRVHRYFTVPFYKGGTVRRLLNHYSYRFSSGLARLEGKVDVLITTAPPLISCKVAVKLAKKFGCKLVYDVRDIWPDVAIEMGAFKEDDFKARSFRRIAELLYKKADLVTTVSEMKVKTLSKHLEKYGKEATLISNGVDEFFINQEPDAAFLNEFGFDKYFSVVHVGNVGKAQDIDSLLDLASEHKQNENIRFFLLGDGVLLKHILERIENEALTNVVYCGRRNMRECFTALKYAKLSYISLVNENLKDSVPTKLFETLYTGCPCILSACGESVKILEESKFGLASHPADKQALRRNFTWMLEHYDEIYANREHCYDYIDKNFNRKNISKKLVEELERLVNEEREAVK